MAKKKYLGMLFITGFMFLLLFLPGSRAFAAANGSWGNAADQVWTLDDNGKLTISGSGELESLKGLEKDLVREVVIEPGVTSIWFTFSYFENMTKITIPDTVEALKGQPFYQCSSLKSVTLPRISEIPTNCFRECTSLESVEIQDGLLAIESGAFSGCSSLRTVSIPDSVTRIGAAFSECTSLEKVNIPAGVEIIPDLCFVRCKNLRECMLPDGLKTIARGAFHCCENLEITIPDSVEMFGDYALAGCKRIYWSDNAFATSSYKLVDGVMFSADMRTLIAYPTGLTAPHYTIPDGVTVIDTAAFIGNQSIQTIDIPASVRNINGGAFQDTGLITATVPGTVQRVGDYAFDDCRNLTELKFCDGVQSVCDNGLLFLHCDNLQKITFPATMTSGFGVVDLKALQWIEIDGESTMYTARDGVLFFFDSNLYWYPAGKTETSYVIPQGTSSIGVRAFLNCVNLTDITIPHDVMVISENAFEGCNDPVLHVEKESYALTYAQTYGFRYVLEEDTTEYNISDFVSRCYSVLLSREVDETGLKAWSAALADGTASASEIIDGIMNSEEYRNKKYFHEASVSQLYRAMLGRFPDDSGLSAWTAVLDEGNPYGTVINGFCGSAEFVSLCSKYGIRPGSVAVNPKPSQPDESTTRGKIEAFVRRCYSLILNRDADQSGLQGWSDALESGAGQACQIIDGFVRSEEYTNRKLDHGASVDILYKTMLNRDADPDGRAGWVDALGQGYTLQHIINGFCGSAEFTAICNDYGISAGTLTVASALVKREAITPEGDEAEAPVVYQGYNSEFINEEKIRAFVEHCYVAVFGREGDTEGVENYTKLILNGKKMPKKVAYEFIFSSEFQEKLPGNEEFIRILYRLYFDREPGAEELSGWVQMLEGGMSLEEIVNGFAGSEEFKLIVNGMK